MYTRLLTIATLAAGVLGCGPEDDEALWTSSTQSAVRVCPGDETVDGIDVSHHQQRINWDQVAADGVQYAFIRVSDGLFEDREFERNWPEARRVGVIRGIYQYFRASRDVGLQVELLLRKMGPLQPGDLPPVIDIENEDGVSDAEVQAAVDEWIALITDATGRIPIVYTYPYFIYDKVRLPALGDYPLWIAHYGPMCPEVPPPWEDWLFHQTSDSGTVAGIEGPVDTDVFNGSLADLHAYADFSDECGDGICTGMETPAECPGDCPVCAPIPAEGRIVDESEICFAALGPAQYWRSVEGDGWDGDLLWTHTTSNANAANYAVWNVESGVTGDFALEAYTDGAWAESVQAAYDVEINGDVERYVVDQTAHDGWNPIATLALEAGDSVEIRLDDNTGEPNADDVRLVADAIRFFPVNAEGPADAGLEPARDAEPAPRPDMGEGPGPDPEPRQDAGDAALVADATVSADGSAYEGARGHDGCTVSVVEVNRSVFDAVWISFLLLGAARRRGRTRV